MNQRLPYLREKTQKLTISPGVYLMKNKEGAIIYIGKAKNLKNRVTSYFRENPDHTPKVAAMVSNVFDYDFIVTDSEFEALLLECSLIKQHKPKYNILLKDDKGYHYYVRNEHDSLFYLDDLSLDAAPAIFELVENIEADTGITFYDSDLPHSWYDNFCYGLLSISHGNPVDFSPRLYPMLGRQSLRTLNFSRRLAYRYYQNYMTTHPNYIDWM